MTAFALLEAVTHLLEQGCATTSSWHHAAPLACVAACVHTPATACAHMCWLAEERQSFSGMRRGGFLQTGSTCDSMWAQPQQSISGTIRAREIHFTALSSSGLHACAGWRRSARCTLHSGTMRRWAGSWARRQSPGSWRKPGCSWRWSWTRGGPCWWMGCAPSSAMLLSRSWAPLRRREASSSCSDPPIVASVTPGVSVTMSVYITCMQGFIQTIF